MRVTLDTAGGFQDPKSILATNPTMNPLQLVWLQGKQSQQPLLVGSKTGGGGQGWQLCFFGRLLPLGRLVSGHTAINF